MFILQVVQPHHRIHLLVSLKMLLFWIVVNGFPRVVSNNLLVYNEEAAAYTGFESEPCYDFDNESPNNAPSLLH